jgi:hypothetical protein
MGMTGSGSTDSPAPSPTDDKIDINPAIDAAAVIAVPAVVDTDKKINIDLATDDKIDIDLATNTAVGITVPSVVGTASPKPEDDVAGSTITVPATVGGFDMAFRLFNFHVDNDGVADLISVGDSMPPATALTTSLVTEGNPSATALPTPLKEEPKPKDSTPSVGSNEIEAPPPSPTTAYCADCDTYHFVGAGDFSSYEIVGCEDPRGGTAAVYPTISECEQALNVLTLRTTPYDPNYVEGLYSDYTCSDDDVYPEAKRKIGNSDSLYSGGSTTSSNEYMVDYD